MDFNIGDKVRLISTGEVGVIVWLWKHEYEWIDAYVAFLGKSFPKNKPDKKPYILRYMTTSLEKYKE